jgi:hypothetical protein
LLTVLLPNTSLVAGLLLKQVLLTPGTPPQAVFTLALLPVAIVAVLLLPLPLVL